MSDEPHGDRSQLIGVEEASALLEVTPDRVLVMVDEGMLVAEDEAGAPVFRRDEVIALRELGG